MWHKSIEISDSDQNIKTNVLIRLFEDSEDGTVIEIEACLKTVASDFYWITERIVPASYAQAFDIISKFDGVSACNFLDRKIEENNLQF